MRINNRKYSKRIKIASAVILIVTALISFSVTGYAKEEKGKQQGDVKTIPATDTSKTTSPVNIDESRFIINMQKEGEIWVEGEKVDLTAIKSRIEDFKNKYPEGNVIITCDKDFLNKKVIEEVLEQVRAAKVKSVVVAASKED
jgi:biopolymer transport protein ExbD